MAGMTEERAMAKAHAVIAAVEDGYGQLANATGDLFRENYVVRMAPELAALLRVMTPYRYERHGEAVRGGLSVCGFRLEIDALQPEDSVEVALHRAVRVAVARV